MAFMISIHAPRVGCDEDVIRAQFARTQFQSTHPVWGATVGALVLIVGGQISIHAPRVGCDYMAAGVWAQIKISIHAPRVGCDARSVSPLQCPFLFQSTHPVWGATCAGSPTV